MADAAIITSIQRYLRKLSDAGIPVDFGVLFGSYAVGGATRDSDIDLIVVSSLFDNMKDRQWVHKLWHVAARTDSRIEPIACGQIQWLTDTAIPIIESARIDGITISLS
jgi:predicted nucleotidyltransferase